MSDQDTVQTPQVPPPDEDAKVKKLSKIMARGFFGLVAIAILWAAAEGAIRYFSVSHDLSANVSYRYLDGGEGYLLVVEILDSFDWYNPKITVNDKYQFRAQTLNQKTTYNVDLLQFTTDSGERFRPDLAIPKKVKIEAGSSWAEWTF